MSNKASNETRQFSVVGGGSRGEGGVQELEFQEPNRHDVGMMVADIPEQQPIFNNNHRQDTDIEDVPEDDESDGMEDHAVQRNDDMAHIQHDLRDDEEDDDSSDGDEQQEGEDEGGDEGDEDPVAERFWAGGGAGRRGAVAGVERIALNQFLQMIAGRIHGDNRQPARDNRELIQTLQQQNVLFSENVINAFMLVPRSMFVPQNYMAEALADNPIRIAQWEFNISAPHMHATCIERLKLSPGESFLDVGTGCGICAAIAALIVGPTGQVLGIDTKPVAVNFARENLQRLRRESSEFSSAACWVDVLVHNVFMTFGPEQKTKTFDKIHVGAQCPEDKIGELIRLLNDDGLLIVPIKQELRLYTKRRGGARPTFDVVNQVRFGELEVPTDAQIVMRSIQIQCENSGRIEVPPSTFYEDLRLINSSFSPTFSSLHSSLSTSPCSSPPSAPNSLPRSHEGSQNWVKRLRSACCINSADRENRSLFGNKGLQTSTSCPLKFTTQIEDLRQMLGPSDAILSGKGFQIKAHKALLRARSGYFRSQYECGMSDVEKDVVTLPGHFEQSDVVSFVDYIYQDKADLQPQQALQVIEIANYFQVPRLLAMCEAVLAKSMEEDPAGACDSVCDLLVLADDNGLQSLRTAALNFVAHHFKQIQHTQGYESLQPRHLRMINDQMFEMHTVFVDKLRQMSESKETSL